MAGARSVALGLISAVIAVAGPGAGAALAAPAAPKLYWGNLGNGTMGEANLAGGGVNQAFMTGFGGGGGEPLGWPSTASTSTTPTWRPARSAWRTSTARS